MNQIKDHDRELTLVEVFIDTLCDTELVEIDESDLPEANEALGILLAELEKLNSD